MLENLKSLRTDMENKNWTICSFIFRYNAIEYIVLVKRFVGAEVRNDKYALVKLHFMKVKDLSEELVVEANSRVLMIDAKSLCCYFGIKYQNNLGDILKQFTDHFGQFIPKSIPTIVTDNEKHAMVRSLSKSDAEDPNKIYCTNVKRNPNENKRSVFNSDKTKLLRSDLFYHFENDETISFCYSADSGKENEDVIILKNFADNNSQ